MVALLDVHAYLFGVSSAAYAASEQMGLYHRPMVGVRFYDVSAAQLEAMHAYFQLLLARQTARTIRFGLLASVMRNVRRLWALSFSVVVEEGNCARWASSGLLELALLQRASFFPKAVLVALVEHAVRTRRRHHVVSYERVRHAHRHAAYAHWNVDEHGPVKPLQPLASALYWQLDTLADVRVDVPPGRVEARVTRLPPHLVWRARRWRWGMRDELLLAAALAAYLVCANAEHLSLTSWMLAAALLLFQQLWW